MDVTTAEEARIAEEAGAVAVMALERVPADIRKEGGVARMSDPTMIREIKKAVTIPVMAKARIGHFVEAQILEALEVDYVDESEVCFVDVLIFAGPFCNAPYNNAFCHNASCRILGLAQTRLDLHCLPTRTFSSYRC